MNEEYIEKGINGQWTDWKFEAENYKRISEQLYKENEQLKEVIEEVREYIYKNSWLSSLKEFNCLTDVEVEHLVQILDKSKENK